MGPFLLLLVPLPVLALLLVPVLLLALVLLRADEDVGFFGSGITGVAFLPRRSNSAGSIHDWMVDDAIQHVDRFMIEASSTHPPHIQVAR